MSFEKFVQRSTKGLFLFIAIAMVLPLVLWGYIGGDGSDDPRSKEAAGTLFGDVVVSRARLEKMKARATPDWWWKQYTGPNAWMMRMRRPEPPKDEELTRVAWENIALLEDARLKGIAAGEKEIAEKLLWFYEQLTGSQDIKGADQVLAGRVREAFQTDLRTFEDWVGDMVVIGKLLDAVTQASFESYEEVYGQMSRDQVLAKARVAGLDPKEHEKALRPSTSDEIARRYEAGKARYKVPAKAVVTSLAPDMEAYKKKVAEPTEAEIRKFYDERKAEYLLPHEHAPGEEHKEGEEPKYKPFDQVKGEIPDKIKTEKAKEEARELMAKVDRALGEMHDAATKTYPADAFEKLKAKFKEQGAELVHTVLPKFAQRDVEELETTIGAGSVLGSWAFDSRTKKGDVSRVTSTSKGVYIFRLLERVEGYDTGVTERVRESLERELRKEQVRTLASKAASRLSQEIATRGVAAAGRGVAWETTRYFRPRNAGETGLEDQGVARAVANQVGAMKPGTAAVVAGAQAGKQDWTYVVYLEDLIPAAAENPETDFNMTRSRLDEEKRRKEREEYPKRVVEIAKIQAK